MDFITSWSGVFWFSGSRRSVLIESHMAKQKRQKVDINVFVLRQYF